MNAPSQPPTVIPVGKEVSPNPRFDLRTWVLLNAVRSALLMALAGLEDFMEVSRTKQPNKSWKQK